MWVLSFSFKVNKRLFRKEIMIRFQHDNVRRGCQMAGKCFGTFYGHERNETVKII